MDVSILRDVRPPVTSYAPNIWADTFSNISLDEEVQKKYAETIEALKQVVRGMLMAAATPIKQMIFIDTLERLGLAYHFETEIEHKLQKIYDDNVCGDDCDLFTTALRFRLLRQHRHHVSCDVFDKFLYEEGKFKGDAEGLLSLYEASHVRFHNEKILEEAERFTRQELSCWIKLQSPLKDKVKRALERPLHREVPILYARHFISIYEKDESMDEHLLKLAKFNFNFLQNLYKKELYDLSRWWNKFDLKTKLPYIRDRLAEAYLWGVGYHFEPQYSYVRKGVVLSIKIIGILDDTYDNYATVNEAQLFTEILDRWSMDEIDRLPDYMKIVLHFVMSAYEEYERDAKIVYGKKFASPYFKETIQQLARGYNQELKWVMEKQMPPFKDYLKNSEITSCIYIMFASIIPGLKSFTQEAIDWIKNEPNFAVKAGLIGRYWDDIGSHKRESKGGEMLTVMDCYMKQYSVSIQETISEFAKAVEDSWKEVNEGWVYTISMSKEITVQFLNYSRMCDASYNRNNGDGYTDPSFAKSNITALFVDPIII
uniref:Gamma-cadinene synthase n=1 Tax=Ocimum basilicum TaxID=39350 RepID=GCS1_OCIBA|nr:RecName: Full=Gamma-cadinene synthase; AltName: Full=(+)-gamma-cadinene synthase [Ocimum basilicum]AAV63787.1 gamma-cadinene synthase [Ocimum basilicum]